MMTSDFTIGTHARALPSNVASQRYGGHILSVQLLTDTDNGNLIAVNPTSWTAWDYYKESAVTTFTGKIIAKDNNGDFVVVVTNPGDALFVYQKPLSPYESPKDLLEEKTMYNKAGDIVRAYTLVKFDKITISAEGFTGADPAVGKNITGVTNKKLVVA